MRSVLPWKWRQNDGAKLRTNLACFKLKVTKITEEDTSVTCMLYFVIYYVSSVYICHRLMDVTCVDIFVMC